jgi:hypothetical protein
MTVHVLDAATTAPATAQTLKLADLADPSSKVKALCSESLAKPILAANVKIAAINFDLSLCGFADSCNPAQTRKVRSGAHKIAGMVGDVRDML